MATWAGSYVSINGYTGCRVRIESQIAYQNAGSNYTDINYQVYADFVGSDAQLDDGDAGWNGGGLWDNGGRVYNFSGNFSNHTVTLNTGWFRVWHDANGNGSYSMWSSVYVYGSGRASASGWTGLPRLPLAPSINNRVAELITNNSVRFGTEINNHGHGTYSYTRMYYKRSNVGTYSQTGDQGDVNGYNYWTVGSLSPNSTYNYFARWWNNNGDTSDSSGASFKTLPQSDVTAGIIRHNKADISVSVMSSATGDSNPTSMVQYRLLGSGTWLDSTTNTSLSFSKTIVGLKPNKTYEYRAASVNSTGTYYGSIKTFKTKNAPGFMIFMEDF